MVAHLGTDIIYTRPWDNSSSSGDLTLEIMERAKKYLIILYNDKDVVEGKTCKSLKLKKSKKNINLLGLKALRIL